MAKSKETDVPAVEPATETAPVKTDRELRWEAFLADARKVNPVRFDAQQANHEFDQIPASFV